MLRCRRSLRQQLCAPALIAVLLVVAPSAVRAQSDGTAPTDSIANYDESAVRLAGRPDYNAAVDLPPVRLVALQDTSTTGSQPLLAPGMLVGENWIAPSLANSSAETAQLSTGDGQWIEPLADGSMYVDRCPPNAWSWQMLPDSLIYHSYLAGVHESRLSIVMFEERDRRDLWDATLGGRVGILRYGDTSCLRPQGWQLDFEGAAIMRFTLDEARDFETADYRAGVPITYGVGDWQFKFGYYHLSSHMGDEWAIRESALGDRINYVRDAVVAGASYFPQPYWRVYSEIAYAFKVDGGAEPWEIQFGTELSRPGPTGRHGTPFVALNAHLREEHDFGGDLTTQLGWLWRGRENQTMRVGLHYFNGKSSQYQTFDDSEEQIGIGVWYDF